MRADPSPPNLEIADWVVVALVETRMGGTAHAAPGTDRHGIKGGGEDFHVTYVMVTATEMPWPSVVTTGL
jgi:hypothetical protein